MRSGQILDLGPMQLGGGGPPYPTVEGKGRAGVRQKSGIPLEAVKSEMLVRCSSANSQVDSCVRELTDRVQARDRSVWPSA